MSRYTKYLEEDIQIILRPDFKVKSSLRVAISKYHSTSRWLPEHQNHYTKNINTFMQNACEN